jgi:hypothetical protein
VGRVTAFNDPEIIGILSDEFVPVATEVSDAQRQDADGAFFRRVTKPIPYWQSGASIFTADGQLLGAGFATSKVEVLELLQSTLPKFQPPAEPYGIEPAGEVDVKHFKAIKPPDGALVVNCIMTNLSERGSGEYEGLDELIPHTVGVDRLWVRGDEVRALAEGTFPESLKRRIVRWHLIDNRNFNQNGGDSVEAFKLELADGRLSGSARINGGKEFAMRLDLLGFVESEGGKVTRFDLVAKGTRRVGDGAEYPVALAFTIADEGHVAYRLPPYPVLAYDESLYLGD